MKEYLRNLWHAAMSFGEAKDVHEKLNSLTGLEWRRYKTDEGTTYQAWGDHPVIAEAVRDKLNEIFGDESTPFYINTCQPTSISVPLEDIRIVRDWDMSYAGVISEALADAARETEVTRPRIPPRRFIIL